MTRKLAVLSAASALAFTALSPAIGQENLQLALGAGLSPAEAAGLSLTEIATIKHNRDGGDSGTVILTSRSGGVAIDPAVHAQLIRSAGLDVDTARGMSLVDAFGYKIDRDNADDNRAAPDGGRAPIPVDTVAHAQLIAVAGLTPQETSGLTLAEVAALKSAREMSDY